MRNCVVRSVNSGIWVQAEQRFQCIRLAEKQFEFDIAEDTRRSPGKKAANAWGLYDMLGNVLEWCDGSFGRGLLGEVWQEKARAFDPASAPRVIRGGSWSFVARRVRAAYRDAVGPSYRDNDLGFRCAEFRQGVVSGARPGSEAKGAEPPVDRDPTSAA